MIFPLKGLGLKPNSKEAKYRILGKIRILASSHSHHAAANYAPSYSITLDLK